MDRTQTIALALITLGILVGVGIIVATGGGSATVRQSTFRAAPGKQLEEARPIVSETAKEAPTEGAPELPRSRDTSDTASPEQREEEPSLPSPPPEPALSPVDEAVLQARNALNPQTGVDRVEELLRSLENLGKASQLYAVKAELRLRFVPPDLESAGAAAAQALQYAAEPEDRDQAGYIQAEVLRRAGDIEAAKEVAADVMAAEGPLSAGKLRASLLQAEMSRAAGDTKSAAEIYRDIMQRVAGAEASRKGQWRDFYRQAALNLVQTLRESGKREEADAIAEEAEKQLAVLGGAHGP
ncbi:MAG: hypothetical protein R6V12_19170 [Candidatus Hydrogenedentota bacterium]